MNHLTFDLESTGTDPFADRITEIAVLTHKGQELFHSLVNPERPISEEVETITGITNEMVAVQPAFGKLAGHVAKLLAGQTIVGFGCNRFDVPLLCEEFARAGVPFDWKSVTWIDAGELFKILAPRTLAEAVKVYLGRDHGRAHRASADACATGEVLFAMREKHFEFFTGKTPAQVAEAARYGKEFADPAGRLIVKEGVVCFGTRRNEGVPVVDDIGYAEWMLDRDFPLATKRVLRDVIKEHWAKSGQRDIFDGQEDRDEPDDWQLDLNAIPFE